MDAGRLRRGRLLLAACVAAALALCVVAALRGTLSYSISPDDVQPGAQAGQRFRVTGTVVPGSLREANGTAQFVLAGTVRQLEVRTLHAPQGAFRAGEPAVVEGVLGADGTLVAQSVIAKHSNTYRARQQDGAASSGTSGP